MLKLSQYPFTKTVGEAGLSKSNSIIKHVLVVAALEEASLLEKSVANKYTLLLVSSEKLP